MNGFNLKNFFKYFVFFILVAILPVWAAVFYVYKKQNSLLKTIYSAKQIELEERQKKLEDIARNANSAMPRTSSWLDVQNKVKDTVVQFFVQVSNFNWLEPYKTPDQFEAYGSGFFINEEGYLVTNFHVVSQASSVQIQIPSFGRERFSVKIVGVCPDKDLALVKLSDEDFKQIKSRLGNIPYLNLGDSDAVVRTQEVLALGYPLGQERLKSTLGIVSGRERAGFIQITAPLNPGNSGGPSVNTAGEVVGINFSGVMEAQSVGYIIPINEVKSAIKDLYKVKLLRRPVLGCIFAVATPELAKYLGNPGDGGWYIAEVFDDTILKSVGVKENDMLFEVNGYKLDLYGELSVPWSEDKISFVDFLNRFKVGDEIKLVIYRKGERKEFTFKLNDKYLPPVRKIYPEFEKQEVDFEVFGGLVLMQLTLNHVISLIDKVPELANYLKPEKQHEPSLLITHVLPDSQAKKTRILTPGSVIDQVNGITVNTLEQFRNAVKKNNLSGYLTIKTKDKMFAALPIANILKDEEILSERYFYKKSNLVDYFNLK